MVGIGVAQPVGLLHVNSKDEQGHILISGPGDLDETYSALYLAGANPVDPRSNSWVFAHKKRLLDPIRTDSLEIARWPGSGGPYRRNMTLFNSGKVHIETDLPNENVLMVSNYAPNSFSSVQFGGNLDATAPSGLPVGAVGLANTTAPGLPRVFLASENNVPVAIMVNKQPVITALPGGDVAIARDLTVENNLTVTGNIQASGTVTGLSDARLKSHVTPLDGYSLAQRLMGIRFKWLRNGEPDIGFIAQEVESVAPELVVTGNNGLKSVKYANISAILVEAFKTLDKKQKVLQQENTELLRALGDLRQRIEALEKDRQNPGH